MTAEHAFALDGRRACRDRPGLLRWVSRTGGSSAPGSCSSRRTGEPGGHVAPAARIGFSGSRFPPIRGEGRLEMPRCPGAIGGSDKAGTPPTTTGSSRPDRHMLRASAGPPHTRRGRGSAGPASAPECASMLTTRFSRPPWGRRRVRRTGITTPLLAAAMPTATSSVVRRGSFQLSAALAPGGPQVHGSAFWRSSGRGESGADPGGFAGVSGVAAVLGVSRQRVGGLARA